MRALPRGSAVVFRHYGDPDRERRGRELRALAKARGLAFLVAGDLRLARRLGADGVHAPRGAAGRMAAFRRERPGALFTAAAHDAKEAALARRHRVDAVLISPVFQTQSHPQARLLGARGFARLVQTAGVPAIALGGMTNETARALASARAVGFAAIGALRQGV